MPFNTLSAVATWFFLCMGLYHVAQHSLSFRELHAAFSALGVKYDFFFSEKSHVLQFLI